MHVKYHIAVFSEKFGWGTCRWLCGCKWKNLGKKDRRITISEHKQYLNELYIVRVVRINIANNF